MSSVADLLGESPGIVAVRAKIERLLGRPSDARRLPPILILGETGTGKGLLARAIHLRGPRRAGPFVDVNCAAIPDTLMEAEMFGFERGAFTDARQAKAGLLQTAHRGTIFLDEVGLLPEALQAKLLTAIEEQAVRRLGSTRTEPIDVWVLTATSSDLGAAVQARRFREDLYHRLAVLTVTLPPLRERGADVVLLAEHFLARACADYQLPPKTLAAGAKAALRAYHWPGNIRELSNAMERVALLSDAPVVGAEMLGLLGTAAAQLSEPARRPEAVSLDDALKGHLVEVLTQTSWNISRAAGVLGISRNTVRARIEKYGLRPVTSRTARAGTAARSARSSDRPAGVLAAPVPAPAGVRWEPRRLTLLRAALVLGPPAGSPLTASRALEMLVDKARSFGGRVEEMGASGIVAAFGHEPVEDAPRRAVHAAMAIHNAAEHARRAPGESMAVKVGIHVGQFLVGQVPAGPEIDLDAKRQAWTVLEALVARSQPNATVVSDAAAPFLERRFELTPAGALDQAPGQAYQLGRRERTGLGLGRRMVGFVGRRRDLDHLWSRLALAAEGHGQVVGIVGEAGIGKSRLLFEFRQSLRGKGLTFLEGRCLSYGSAIPYSPILDILRRNFGITETDHPQVITGKIRAGLQQVEMEPDEWAPYVLQLLGVKEGIDRLAAMSPEVIKERTFETLRQLCLKGSRLQPIILVLEDLHWSDKTSEECVAWLVEGGLAGAPILFLCTYRPGHRPPWLDKSYATQVALPPLSPQESLTVVKSVLQTDRLPDPVAQLILTKAEGNPFFLEELSRVIGEERELRPTPAVPETIQEVLLARIHRLPDEPRRLLQTAAVLGREVSLRLLAAIWAGPGALESHLRDLMRQEFLYQKTRAAEPIYVFTHALTQEVAYESIQPGPREALHVAAGRALEQIYADRREEVDDHLAYHYSRTDAAAKAVEYLTRVAAKAARAHAHAEAVTAVREALAHVERLPADEREPQLLNLVLRQGSSLIPLGRIPEILELLLRTQEGLERLEDPARIGRYYFQLGRVYSFLADHERAAQCAERAIDEAGRCGDEATAGKAHFLLALEGVFSGQARQGIEHGRQAVALLERAAEPWWVGSAQWVVGLNFTQLGEFETALEVQAQARAIGEAIGDVRLQTLALWGTGIVHLAMGDWQVGVEGCRNALGRAPDPLNTALASAWLGYANLEKGTAAEAIPLLEPAVRQLGQYEFRALEGLLTIFLAEAHLLEGDVDKARELTRDGLGRTQHAGFRYGSGWGERALGRISKASDALSDAEAHLTGALAAFESIQARYEVARTHLDLAEVTFARGHPEAATAHLTDARSLFRALRIPRYVERTERLAAELEGRGRPAQKP